MDGVYHLATYGMCPIHVRANWDGHRDGFGGYVKTEVSKMGSGHFRRCSLCREHDQCRGRFGRYVGCRWDAHQVQLTLVRRALWNRDRLFDGSFPVLSNCKDFEMAGVVSLCLCHNGFCYPTRLARRSARHVRPFMAKGHDAWQNHVAILGTTISPYLFFWQASEEVEEDKAMGRRMLRQP